MGKNKIVGIMVISILLCLLVGVSYADTSYHIRNGMYINLPSYTIAGPSASGGDTYYIGDIIAVIGKSKVADTPAAVYTFFTSKGYTGVQYGKAHNVNYVKGTEYDSDVLTWVAVFASDSDFSYLLFGRPYGDTRSQNTIDNIISTLCIHELSNTIVVEPTCTTVGYQNKKCIVCGFEAAGDEIPALGHTEVIIPGKAATEAEDGLTDGKMCSICGAILVEQQVIPKLTSKDGLHLDEDSVYRLYKNGVLDFDTYGIVNYAGGRFFVANALIVQQDGLISDGANWYFVSQGQVADYTGLALYDGEWFYVTNGILDVTRNGIVEYDGGRFMVAAGRILQEANGLIQDPISGKWYFVSGGQVASNYRGLALYDDHWFYIWDGVFQSDAEGWVDHDGSTFYVKGGMVV